MSGVEFGSGIQACAVVTASTGYNFVSLAN
jgi:hypothetical protein